jgi:TolB-like protein
MNANSFRPSCITISPFTKVLRQIIIRHLLRRATLFLTVLLLAGCSKRYSDLPSFFPFGLGDYENQSVGRFKTSYIADQIDEFFRGTDPGPVGITTFVNLEDLHTTSPFGRLCGEQLMSELTMRGYDVIELRHGDAITFLNPDGEFSLSREAEAVRRSQRLGAILAGTYSASPERVYVNVRLVDPSSSRVLSAASVEMSRTKEISKLLRGGSIPLTLERVPVRNLSQIGNATVAPGSNIGQPIVIPRDSASQGSVTQSPLSSGATIRY